MPYLEKTCILAAIAIGTTISASAHKVHQKPAYQAGDTYQTADGKTVVYTQIGDSIYECIAAPEERVTIIANSIYQEQRRNLGLHRLTYRERKAASLPKRLYERYLKTLPIQIGAQPTNLQNTIISSHTRGRGLCVGISAGSEYAGQKRSGCKVGLALKVSFSSRGEYSTSDWCVLGADTISTLPSTAQIENSGT